MHAPEFSAPSAHFIAPSGQKTFDAQILENDVYLETDLNFFFNFFERCMKILAPKSEPRSLGGDER